MYKVNYFQFLFIVNVKFLYSHVNLPNDYENFGNNVLFEDKQNIYIAGLFPISDGSGGIGMGSGILPAVNLAIEHINEDRRYLRDYQLKMEYNDTKCDMGTGTKMFFEMMHNQPEKVILFGDACSNVTAPIAESSKWWNIWQLSYADTNPLLSDRKTYPNFFRTVPSDMDYNPARIALLRRFNWSIVGTVFQDASKGSSRYAYAHSKLTTLLDDSEESIDRETQSFSSDPKPALAKFKEKDIRIIIGNFDEHMARRVFCSAHEEGMYGPKYVWIILGDYSPYWWNATDPDIPCTPAQLQATLEGYIATDVLVSSRKKKVTISNRTPKEYLKLYNKSRKGNYSKFHGYAYDGIWAIGIALDKIIQESNGKFYLEDFRSVKMAHALNETNFYGVTGRVQFKNGDRVGGILYKQFQNGHLVDIGEYNSHNTSMRIYQDFKWQGSSPPLDKSERQYLKYRINLPIYVSMCTLAGMGVILALFFLIVNVIYRNHRYIKMSSPNMNNLIIVGCILAYVSVFLLGTDGIVVTKANYGYMCYARTWTLCIAFTLAFGAMFSKTWRVHAIFTNIKMNKKVIKDYQLFIVVAVLLGIDVILLNAWIVLDPMIRDEETLEPEIDRGDGDKEIIYIIEYCISNHMSIWLGVLYAYKGLLLLVGCFLAWETRQVSIPALNDSKYIGMSVYNIVITCVAGVAISFVVKDKPDSGFLIIALFIIFCTTITLCLVFVPKVIELKIDPRGDERRIRATLRKSISVSAPHHNNDDDITHKIHELAEENIKYRQILEDKKHEIEELLTLLGEDAFTEDVPVRNCVNTPLLYEENINRGHQDDQCSLISNSSGANVWSPDDTGDNHTDSYSTPRSEHIELTQIKKLPSKESMKSYEGLKELTTNNFNSLKETDIISHSDTDTLQGDKIDIEGSSTSISGLFRDLSFNIDQMLKDTLKKATNHQREEYQYDLGFQRNDNDNEATDPTDIFQSCIDALPPNKNKKIFVKVTNVPHNKRESMNFLEEQYLEPCTGNVCDAASAVEYFPLDENRSMKSEEAVDEKEKLLLPNKLEEKLF